MVTTGVKNTYNRGMKMQKEHCEKWKVGLKLSGKVRENLEKKGISFFLKRENAGNQFITLVKNTMYNNALKYST